MIKFQQAKLSKAIKDIKLTDKRPYVYRDDLTIKSPLRTISIVALTDAEAFTKRLVPLHNFEKYVIVNVHDGYKATLAAASTAALEDIKSYIEDCSILNIDMLMWYQKNIKQLSTGITDANNNAPILYESHNGFNVAQLAGLYENKIVLLVSGEEYQAAFTLSFAKEGYAIITTVFNPEPSGLAIENSSGYVIQEQAEASRATMYITNKYTTADMLLKTILSSVTDDTVEQRLIVSKLTKALTKYFSYYINILE